MTPLERRILFLLLVGILVLVGMIVERSPQNSQLQTFKKGNPNTNTRQDTFPIDINEANMEILEKLPGIGPSKAKSIVEFRKTQGPFRSYEDILKVPGIGTKTLERIKPFITPLSTKSDSSKSPPYEHKNLFEKINVNTATFEKLLSLPGIGEVKARNIIENRPYRKLEDLLRVPGIGKKTLERIRDLITF